MADTTQKGMALTAEARGILKEKLCSRREEVLTGYYERVVQDYTMPLPTTLTGPYVARLGELLSADVEARTMPPLPLQAPARTAWLTMCRTFVDKLQNKQMSTFSHVELGVSEVVRDKLLSDFAQVFAFSRRALDESKHARWKALLEQFYSCLPQSEVLTVSRTMTFKLLEQCRDKEGQRELVKVATRNLAQKLAVYDEQRLPYLLLCLFVHCSGFLTPDNTLRRSPYNPMLRAAVRKMLHHLQIGLQKQLGELGVDRYFTFTKYREFEESFGCFRDEEQLLSSIPDRTRGGPPVCNKSKQAPEEIDLLFHFGQKALEAASHPSQAAARLQEADWIRRSELCTLTCLTTERHSPHVLICVSGFATEQADHRGLWRHLLRHDEDDRVFVLRWPACTAWKLVKSALASLAPLLLATTWATAGVAAVASCALAAKRLIAEYTKAAQQAKATGALLAHALLERYPFSFQNVSLLGLGLGTVAVLACLKEMSALQGPASEPIIDSVYLLGGTKAFRRDRTRKWQECMRVVHGRIVNCYSVHDWALKVLSLAHNLPLIGRAPFEFDLAPQLPGAEGSLRSSPKIENCDLSQLGIGHSSYLRYLPAILDLIHFA